MTHCESITTHFELITTLCQSITTHCESITTHFELITTLCQSITTHCELITTLCQVITTFTESVTTLCKSRHCESVTTLVLMSLSLLSCECVTYVELCRGSTLWHSWYVSSVTLTTLTSSRYTLRQYCYCCWRLWLMTTY